VCVIGARMVRRMVLAKGGKKNAGKFRGVTR
jgi:hypothetical protein